MSAQEERVPAHGRDGWMLMSLERDDVTGEELLTYARGTGRYRMDGGYLRQVREYREVRRYTPGAS